MVFKILKSNYEAMTDNYNISLSFTYGRSVVFFANKTDHQEITDSVNNHKTNTFLQEYRVYIVFPCISSIHFNPPPPQDFFCRFWRDAHGNYTCIWF